MTGGAQERSGQPGQRQLWAYALPALPLSILVSPFPALLMAFYAKYTSATTAGIATIVLLARIFNGVIDPPIGYLSDRTRTILGPRKPWLVGGALLSLVTLPVAFMPPDGAGNAWFALAIFCFYLTHSVIDTPYRTWSGEISADYHGRSRLAGAQTIGFLAGGLFLLALPELLSLPAIGLLDSPELDREAMAILGWTGLLLMPLGIGAAVLMLPAGEPSAASRPYGFLQGWTLFATSGPFRRFIGADVISSLGWATSYGLMVILIDDYFGFGEGVVMFLIVATLAQVLAVPLCARLGARFGKHRVYAVAQVANGLLLPLYLVFPPDGQADFNTMLLLGGLISALGTPNMMFPVALLADIADHDQLRTGMARSGSFFAMRTLLVPGGAAIGGALGFYLLALVGFDPGSDGNSPDAVNGMLATAIGVPLVAFVISGCLMYGFPITARRHAAIRRRLERRARTGNPV